jgi:hypothetical protein
MSGIYSGLVRKLATPKEQAEIDAKYPAVIPGGAECLSKSSPSGLTRRCLTCGRPAQHDGPHVAYRDRMPVAIWGSPKPFENPQWLITPAVGMPLVEEVHRR